MTKTVVASARYTGLVMALHHTSQGFGWVLFENPHSPVAWSIVRTNAGRELWIIDRFKHLLNRYEPAVVILEDFTTGESRRVPRIRKLCRAVLGEAARRKIETRVFTREVVRDAFARYSAATRNEIARVIADRIDGFSHRLPPPRTQGGSSDLRQSLFDAAALAITYFVAMGDHDWSD